MKLLVLSNGHGEDEIAIRIIEQLQIVINNLELAALPIVGQGFAYKKKRIPIVGRVQQMPSGGFIFMEGNPLWQDIRSGLIGLTVDQIRIIRQWGKGGGYILAVGDIVPLLFAYLSKTNYAFVGTAKSEYYLQDETAWLAKTNWLEKKFSSVYLPWERWLMSQDACKAVFPRDSLTTKILQQWSIPAFDLGNPMMDGIIVKTEQVWQEFTNKLSILLLPGSRVPEALNNWQQILVAVAELMQTLKQQPLELLAAIAPALNLQPFIEIAVTQGWQVKSEYSQNVTLTQNKISLILSQNKYQQLLQQANIAIAMAGTATEQFVGLGKPAIIMPGKGPQFTYAFAEAQTRLLGCSIIMVDSPSQVGMAISKVINNPQQLAQIDFNGKLRMGQAGAAYRIAQCLKEKLLKSNKGG